MYDMYFEIVPLSGLSNKRPTIVGLNNVLAGDEGFEPPITGPEPVALPLGQSPRRLALYDPSGLLSTI